MGIRFVGRRSGTSRRSTRAHSRADVRACACLATEGLRRRRRGGAARGGCDRLIGTPLGLVRLWVSVPPRCMPHSLTIIW